MATSVKRIDTVIIGAGISGLAAANALRKHGREFVLVSDNVGGRLFHSIDPPMNLGATYINDDYKHVREFVGFGQKLKLRQVYASNGEKLVPFLHWSNIRHVFGMLRLLCTITSLRREINEFRKRALFEEQHELIKEYPLMRKLVTISAEQLMTEMRLTSLYNKYFKHVFYATCFAPPDKSNALFFLGTLFPLVINTYVADFSRTKELLIDPITDNLIRDRVSHLEALNNGWFTISCESGRKLSASNVIIATPFHNAKRFYLGMPEPAHCASGTVIYVCGIRRKDYVNKQFLLFNPEVESVCLIWRQANGSDLIFAVAPHPELSKYYESHEIMKEVDWKTAVVLSGKDWVPQKLGSNLYLAGDYNICGMEDSYISGLYAATEIIKHVP